VHPDDDPRLDAVLDLLLQSPSSKLNFESVSLYGRK